MVRWSWSPAPPAGSAGRPGWRSPSGARVVVAARRADALEDLAPECQAAGGQALGVPTDMTDEPAVAELARRAVERFGRIDVWVNNAGVCLLGLLEATPPEAFRRVLETNFFGYVHGPARCCGGAGRLVTVAEAVAPRRFERVNHRYIDGLQIVAEPAPANDGNLYAPVSSGRAEARGGWRPGPTRQPRSAGWPRSDCWPPAHSHRTDRHPLRPDLTGKQPRSPDAHRRLPSGQSEQLLPHSRKPGPRVDTLRAAKVEIRCDRAQPVQFDGDTVEPTDRLDLEIDPSSLTLAVPEHPPGPAPQSGRTPTSSLAQVVIPAVIPPGPTGPNQPHSTERLPNLSCLDPTGAV
jgi:short chain dehydrogenase